MALQLVPAKETAISPVCPLNQSTIEVNLFLADKNWLLKFKYVICIFYESGLYFL